MAASRLYLPKLDTAPATVLEYLSARFPHVSLSIWRERMTQGLVTIDERAAAPETAYRHGVTVRYQRAFPSEPESPEPETVIYEDTEILVADKPHGMPVTPAGAYVTRSLLWRLESRTRSDAIAPLHRLDRDTAGLVLFSLNAATRAIYHALFAKQSIQREYLAIARLDAAPDRSQWLVENRIVNGEPWFRQKIVEGAPNAVSQIELVEAREGKGLFLLRPRTGRKHQLRLHMCAIGFPIIGDPLYPQARERLETDPPMRLLATRLSFVDPVTGLPREFRSARKLE
jgi:tRNA pseudouridine32 synthase/23S rRNA pseudouridine746 synthase